MSFMAGSQASELSNIIIPYAKALHAETQPQVSSFDQYLRDLTAPENDVLKPDTLDANHPLSHYFISSSHNTYLSGNQLYGRASTKPYKNVLLRGGRCLEVDCWDGVLDINADIEKEEGHIKHLRHKIGKDLRLLRGKKDNAESISQEQSDSDSESSDDGSNDRVKAWHADRCEPRVLHGHTATRSVSFRSVCDTIGKYAFKTSDLPVIVSLEIHTNPEQQQMMVDIMRESWGDYLVDNSADINDSTPLPSLESLRNKILIKVKHSSASKPKKTGHVDNVDSSDDEGMAEAVKKGSIIPALGSMGAYTRSCHFKSFSQPEAKLPTHVFALSEKKLIDIHSKDPSALFTHNKTYLMRAYPKGVRVSSSNLDPAPLWRSGVQMVALNWQYMNASMMLNHGMFNDTGGWVLKPTSHRDMTVTTPAPSTGVAPLALVKRGSLSLSIELFAAQGISLPDGDKLRASVRCELHVDQPKPKSSAMNFDALLAKEGEYKISSQTVTGHPDPDFRRQVLEFRDIKDVTEDLSFLRLKIMNDDGMIGSDLVAWTCIRLCRLREGVRLLRLCDCSGKQIEGRLMVRIKKTFITHD